jgi:hypothetical protein
MKTLILHYYNEIINTVWEVDRAILDIHELEKYLKLKVHRIPLNCVLGKETQGVQ